VASAGIVGGGVSRFSLARRVAFAVALAVVSASCSDNNAATPSASTGSDRSGSTSTTLTNSTTSTAATATTSSPPSQAVEDEIIARYISHWEARFTANSDTPDPDDPALREFATGEQLETVVNETRANLEQGLAFRHAASPSGFQRVTVIEVDGDHAVVQECVVADAVIVRRDTGEVVNDAVATHNVRGELLRVDGVWKVVSARLVQRWEGVAGCALGS